MAKDFADFYGEELRYLPTICAIWLSFFYSISVGADLDHFAQQGVERLSRYLRIDTINPPGNEIRGVELLSDFLDEAGVSYQTAESAPGRGNIWARLKGGDKPALLSAETDATEIDDSYIIARATALAYSSASGGPNSDPDAKRQQAAFWFGMSQQSKQNFPMLTNVRTVT